MTKAIFPHNPAATCYHRFPAVLGSAATTLAEPWQDPERLEPQTTALEQAINEKWTSVEEVLSAAAGSREKFGELLLLAGRITRDQLAAALSEQKLTDERLGELLVRKGWATSQELEAILAFQQRQGGTVSSLSLGNLLVGLGVISLEQLDDALAHQSMTGTKLGAVLVEKGHAEPHHVMHGLQLQRRLLKTALVVLLSLAASATPPVVLAAQTSHALTVSATVLPYASLDVVQSAPKLTITSADVMRGFVEVPAGTQVKIQSNSQHGVLLNFNMMQGVFKSVRISGFGSPVDLGAEGGAIVQRLTGHGPQLVELGYRFFLETGVQPGDYVWPVVLTAQAL